MPIYEVKMSQFDPSKSERLGAPPEVRLRTEDLRHAGNYLRFAFDDALKTGGVWFGHHVMLYNDGEMVLHKPFNEPVWKSPDLLFPP